jgi:hypothetical protein
MMRFVTPITVVQIVLNYIGLNLGWVYLFMGVMIGSAVIPLWNLMTWKDASGKGAVLAAWGGLALAMIGWLIAAQVQGGKITVATLGTDEVMLSGNLIAIFSSGIIHYLYSKFVDPQNFDFATLDSNIHLVEQDLSGLSAAEQDKVMIRKTKRWITNRGYVLTFVLVILWPVLSIPAQVFSKGYFAFWVVISIGWAFAAGITITIMPLWESQTEIIRVFSGIMNYCMGKSGNAAEYAEETAPAKTVEEPAAKAVEEEEVDAEFAEMLKA